LRFDGWPRARADGGDIYIYIDICVFFFLILSDVTMDPNSHDVAGERARTHRVSVKANAGLLAATAILKQGPHRLVVRTSRRGRDNPGSTPGVDILQFSAVAPASLSCARARLGTQWCVRCGFPHGRIRADANGRHACARALVHGRIRASKQGSRAVVFAIC
jgi:hypothetical protein